MVLNLLGNGEDVVVLDNLSTGAKWAVPAQAELIVGDIGDGGLVKQILQDKKIEAIIHFARSIIVPESIADPLGYYLNNTVKIAHFNSRWGCLRCEKFHFFLQPQLSYGMPTENPVLETARH